jgi:indolepyruvate ferredoxin oxidoreductase
VISGALAAIHDASRAATVLDAAGVAMARVGHEQFANIVLTGAAYQLGTLPFSVESIERAIELNGVSVEANLAAFRWGRREVSAPTPAAADGTSAHVDLQGLAEELAAYQNVAYAERFVRQVDRVREREMDVTASPALTEAVARNLFKLMAYKDEYEVARLSLDPKLDDALSEQFGPGARHRYQLHPPILRALGMRRKIALGPWIRPVFRALVAMRRLRGTPFDPFGYAEVRRTERALVGEYLDVIDQVLNGLTSQNHSLATEIAELPDLIRGYENIKLNGVSRFRERAAEELARFRATTA